MQTACPQAQRGLSGAGASSQLGSTETPDSVCRRFSLSTREVGHETSAFAELRGGLQVFYFWDSVIMATFIPTCLTPEEPEVMLDTEAPLKVFRGWPWPRGGRQGPWHLLQAQGADRHALRDGPALPPSSSWNIPSCSQEAVPSTCPQSQGNALGDLHVTLSQGMRPPGEEGHVFPGTPNLGHFTTGGSDLGTFCSDPENGKCRLTEVTHPEVHPTEGTPGWSCLWPLSSPSTLSVGTHRSP